MSESSKAVFLSYASQDAATVERIAEALRASGVEVWFDKNELVGGDAWDQKIRGQIKSCTLFVPVISAATQARLEGYFRLEWKLAAQRTHTMADAKPFLLPVVIDATRDAEAHVPEEFRAVQWTRLIGGETPEKFCERVKKLLGGGVVAGVADPGPASAKPATAKPSSRARLVATMIGITVTGVLAFWQPWKKSATPTTQATPAATASDARQLVARVYASQLDSVQVTRATFDAADRMCERAAALEPLNAEVWAAWAYLDAWLTYQFERTSGERNESARTKMARALSYAPDSFHARLAQAAYFAYLVPEQSAARAEAILRQLAVEQPEHPGVIRLLAYLFRRDGRADEMQVMLDRLERVPGYAATAHSVRGWTHYQSGRLAAAKEAAEKSIAAGGWGSPLDLKIRTCLQWDGDLEAAKRTLDQMSPDWLLENQGVNSAMLVYSWRREPDEALRVLRAVNRDWLVTNASSMPKALMMGQAYLAGNKPDAAKSEFQRALELVNQRLTAAPGDPALLGLKVTLLDYLGESAAAADARRLLAQVSGSADLATPPTTASRLADLEAAVASTARGTTATLLPATASPLLRVTAANLRLNPAYDDLRAEPRFQALRARAEADPLLSPRAKPGTPVAAPDAQSAPADKSGATPAVSDKSLVVLPLENLSPDPENAFFTDGMHAEIISTLGRISDLKVISRDSALTLKGSTASLAEKAQKLGVANVITGSVRRAGDRVRILLELRRASDDALLWSLPKPDRDLKDVLTLQTEIAEQVARVMQARASKGSYAGARFTTKDPRAYDLFLKAQDLFDGENRSMDEAIRLAEEALRLDPEFATAANLLAHAHQRATSGLLRIPADRFAHAQAAKRWAEVTARLMPGGAGDGALAVYLAQSEADFGRALPLAESAHRALPNDAEPLNYLALATRGLGKKREAAEFYRRATVINPRGRTYWLNLISLLAELRQVDECTAAMRQYRGVATPQIFDNDTSYSQFVLGGELLRDPERRTAAERVRWYWRARRFADLVALVKTLPPEILTESSDAVEIRCRESDAWSRLGRDAEAAAAARAALALAEKLQSAPEIGPTEKPGWMALALARNGRTDEAEAAAQRFVGAVSAETQLGRRWPRESFLAEIYALLNRPRECVELLAKLLRVPSGLTVPMLKVDPAWDNVRDAPAFKALLADPKNSAPL